MSFSLKFVSILLLLSSRVLCVLGSTYDDNYCNTKECVITASQLYDALDLMKNPCENFYDYICGSFVQNKVVHDRYGAEGFSTILQDQEDEILRRILSSSISKSDIFAFQKIKSAYTMCIDHDKLDKLGLNPVFDVLTKFGGWALLGEYQSKENSLWQDLYESMNKEGFSLDYFLSIYLTIDPRNTSTYIIKMIPPEPENFNQKYYDLLPLGLNNSIINAYYTYMKEFTVVLGAPEDQAGKEMLEVLEFEQKLYEIKQSSKDFDEQEIVTIAELQQKYSSVKWNRFVESLTGGVKKISANQSLALSNPKYFGLLNILINGTAEGVIKNYLFWRVVDFSVFFLPIKYKKPALKFSDFAHGSLQIEQRWKRCVSHVKLLFPVGTASMLARKLRSNQNVIEPHNIILAVKNQTVEYVQKLKLRREEKKHLMDKMENVILSVGYPKEYFSDESMNDFHKDFEIVDGQYFKSALAARQLRNRRYRERLLVPVEATEWQSYDDSESYYSFSKNTIFVTSAFLQVPHYDKSLPNYINYAGLGRHTANLFGIALVFELRLLKFPEYRNLSNNIKRQYETFVENTYKFSIDGSNADHINMADLFAYYLAYRAFQSDPQANNSLRLPGIHFTREQFFWVYSAQKFCEAIKPQEAFQTAKLSSFPINAFRVNGPLKSNKSFQRDFNCPP